MKLAFKISILSAMLISSISGYGQNHNYSVLRSYPVAGDIKWDYLALNPVTGNLYISHGTQVMVIDPNDGTSKAVIDSTPGVHGIAFAPKYSKGYISNGKGNNVTVFDITTNQTLMHIKTGENPDAIMYEDYTNKLIVCNGKTKDLTVIDPQSNTVVATLALDGKPETAVSDGLGKLYINIEDKNEIAVVNLKKMEIEHRWHLGKGIEPSGLAIDRKSKRLFSGCDKILTVVDAQTGKIIQEVSIGEGCDGVMFSPISKTIYSANGDGTLTIIAEKNANTYVVMQNLHTQKGARTLELDTKNNKIYLPTAEFETTKNTDSNQHKRPVIKRGSFKVLVVG